MEYHHYINYLIDFVVLFLLLYRAQHIWNTYYNPSCDRPKGAKKKSTGGFLDSSFPKKRKRSSIEDELERYVFSLHFDIQYLLNFDIIRYLAEPELAPTREDPLQWWVKRKSDYPNLWKMARDLLGIPATSTPSERIFSRAGDLYRKKRNRLLGETAQALMGLGAWWNGQGLPGDQVPIFKHRELEQLEAKPIQLPVLQIKKGVVSFIEENGWDRDMIEDDSGDSEYDPEEESNDDSLILNEELILKDEKGKRKKFENEGDRDDLEDDESDSDDMEDGKGDMDKKGINRDDLEDKKKNRKDLGDKQSDQDDSEDEESDRDDSEDGKSDQDDSEDEESDRDDSGDEESDGDDS